MVKTWSDDNPKAALMERKRTLIVDAALRVFLESGYAESSVNRIAAEAGVSIKTLYRHFENKDDLFSAVMHAACSTSNAASGGQLGGSSELEDPPWFADPLAVALPFAGQEYLRHVLSDEQLSLYRVVTRDAHRFPELGRRYREEVTGRRDEVFANYLDRWLPSTKWKVKSKQGAAATFAALLKVEFFDDALHGLRKPELNEIIKRAHEATDQLLTLLEAGRL